jgi:hypothetical protein
MHPQQARNLCFVVLLPYLLLLGSLSTVLAEEKADAPVKKAAKPTKVAAKKPAKAAPAPPPPEVTEDVALAAFDTFTIEWMKKLAQTEEFQRTTKVKVTQSAEGFLAEYIGYFPHRYITIKKTESKDTPFVGILTYYEKTMRCTGKTKEEAIQGPFEPVGQQQVSEIFRFTKGKWAY